MSGMEKKHMKTWIIPVIAVLVILAAVIICTLVKRHIENSIQDGPDMANNAAFESVTYWKGGGEFGATYEITFDGSKVKVSDCMGNGYSTEDKSYDVDSYALCSELEGIIRDNDMMSWTDLKAGEIDALDGEYSEVTIEGADGTLIYISSNYELPDGGYAAMRQIREAMENAIDSN